MNKKMLPKNAFSIPEMMVVMILTGILVLSIFDGLLMLRKFAIDTAESITTSKDSLLEYYKENKYTIVNGKVIDGDTMLHIFQDLLFIKFKQEEDVYYEF